MRYRRLSLHALILAVGLAASMPAVASAHDPDMGPVDTSGSADAPKVASKPPIIEGYERIAGQKVYTSAHGETVEMPGQDLVDATPYTARSSGAARTLAGSIVARVRNSRCNRIENKKRRKKCRALKKQNGEQPPAPAPTPAPAYSPWCGSEAYADINPADPELRQVKVIYAKPADSPLNLQAYGPMIQSDVEFINHYFSQESGGTRVVRFDFGTSCGPRYVDIQIVNLPLTYLADGWNVANSGYLIRTTPPD